MDRYVVKVFDQAGEYCEAVCLDFAHLLKVVAYSRVRYPGKVVQACNLDNVDLGWADGLTDDEREAVDNVEVA